MAGQQRNIVGDEVPELMAEGFGGPQPAREVPSEEVPAATSSGPVVLGPLGTDFCFYGTKVTRDQLKPIFRKYDIDRNVYRLGLPFELGRMSTLNVPIPLAHFEVGLRLPMDPAFVDFLVFARIQPGQLHPNAVRTLFSLICLGRRLGFELSMNILGMFFSALRMSDNTLSLRPRRNRVQLFDSPPNKVDFRSRWVSVESKVGFPFQPCVNEGRPLVPVHPSSLDPSERSFFELITRDLGLSRDGQSRVYSSKDLLSDQSLEWCGIGGGLESRKRELGFRPEVPNAEWTLHPGGLFFFECDLCPPSSFPGCQPSRGNFHFVAFSFYFVLDLGNNFLLCFFRARYIQGGLEGT